MRQAVFAFIGVVVATAAVGLPSVVAAQTADVFENTVVSRYPDGGWVKHWFNRDGSYAAEFSDGRRLAARWRVEGEKVCLNGIRPSVMLISRFCSPLIQASLGESWTSRDPLGRRVQNELQQGR
ncbi:MAG: hypothetical protein Q8S03_04095 [Brevundimonas sp.]|uniref:hypothetical protein n=1 Tax=Brevundimonas sp. TaxID=1871086 RepID=UPI0027373B17|nr:hypothetical protein [Brevundimonas sp.]MDP3403849.1 hypothetical protein [Brevundimonas sp.]